MNDEKLYAEAVKDFFRIDSADEDYLLDNDPDSFYACPIWRSCMIDLYEAGDNSLSDLRDLYVLRKEADLMTSLDEMKECRNLLNESGSYDFSGLDLVNEEQMLAIGHMIREIRNGNHELYGIRSELQHAFSDDFGKSVEQDEYSFTIL